jgi:hypothetical protein
MTAPGDGIRGRSPEVSLEPREELVRAIVDRARPILAARRAARGGVLGMMERWRRPIFSISAGLIAAGIAVVLLTDDRPHAVEPVQEMVFPEALVPRPIAAWLGRGDAPDVLELMTAIGGYRQ